MPLFSCYHIQIAQLPVLLHCLLNINIPHLHYSYAFEYKYIQFSLLTFHILTHLLLCRILPHFFPFFNLFYKKEETSASSFLQFLIKDTINYSCINNHQLLFYFYSLSHFSPILFPMLMLEHKIITLKSYYIFLSYAIPPNKLC